MSSMNVGRSEIAAAKSLPIVDLVSYQEGSVVSRVVLKREKGNITIFAFDAGRELGEHTSAFDALVQAVDGQAEVTVSGKPMALTAGEIVLLPAEEPHGIKAVTRFKMILTMIRP